MELRWLLWHLLKVSDQFSLRGYDSILGVRALFELDTAYTGPCFTEVCDSYAFRN